MKKIDEKIAKVYDFIVEFSKENGFPPSIREICENTNIKSTATAYSYVEKLKSKGLLSKTSTKNRALKVSNLSTNIKTIPLVGVVTAGTPILAQENIEGMYPLPPEFDSNSDFFALTVQGTSMINAGIYDGDKVIVKKQNTAENGEIVVALIDDSATVKRFYKKQNKIILHPENDELSDIIVDNVYILGIVKGLFRKI
ncbi:MAG: transcriptional repressor LexA [Clostridiales bacterium]|nr:transcriptional repressor LexA [Clostridiales bacterium]